MFIGCDCLREVSGVVLDQESRSPINGAEVRERHKNGSYDFHSSSTDALGAFEFGDVSGGFQCPDVELHFSKDGYVPLDRTFPHFSSGDTIFMNAE